MSNVAGTILGQGFPKANYFIIGGTRSPGKASLIEAKKVFGWQINKGFGLTGATVVPSGDELVEAAFLIEIWDARDVPDWDDFAARYLSKALVGAPGGVTPMALGILHPSLNGPPLNVAKVVVKEVNPLLNDGLGLWTTTVRFLQYRPPVPALSRPLAAIPAAAATKPTAQDAADREMQAKAATIQDLGNKLSTAITGGP